MTRFTNAVAAVVLAAGVCAPAEATRYTGTFGGTTPTGWTDTTGVFGAPGTVYEGVAVTGQFTLDLADYNTSAGCGYQCDAAGAATPGYSVSVTLNGVTVGQPDGSSYFGAYFAIPGGILNDGSFGVFLGGWYGSFYLESTLDPSTTAAFGLTPASESGFGLPAFGFNVPQLEPGNRFIIDNGAGGRLAAIPLTSFSMAPVPAVPEPASWAMMLIGFGALGVALRRRRAMAMQTA